ncbi:MAG: hypothetical protein U9N49_03155 [Campylobacterota bacterium]|nr:hypothetical protein [Campylobacterota bacterium]
MKHLYKTILLLTIATFFTGCMHQPSRPYYFPVMNLELQRYFANEMQSKKQLHTSKYHTRARALLLKSGYFKRLSSYSPYNMDIEYNQYIHSSVLEVVGKALNPINAIFGVDAKASVEMKVFIRHHNRIIERYSYHKEFSSDLDEINQKAKHYFDDFMEQLIEDMVQRSKIKRVQ